MSSARRGRDGRASGEELRYTLWECDLHSDAGLEVGSISGDTARLKFENRRWTGAIAKSELE